MTEKNTNIYILEDEKLSQDLLLNMILDLYPHFKIVGISDTLDQAQLDFKKLDIDIAFLDINLHGESVFSILDQDKPLPFKVIFTTAFSDYAVKAFKHSAVDYLLKPVDEHELEKAIEKAIDTDYEEEHLEILSDNLKCLNKLVVNVSNGFKFVNTSDILYLQADKIYTDVFTVDDGIIKSTKGLNHFTSVLSDSFFRIHHSYIINLEHLVSFNAKDLEVELTNGMTFNVSVRKKSEFLSTIHSFNE